MRVADSVAIFSGIRLVLSRKFTFRNIKFRNKTLLTSYIWAKGVYNEIHQIHHTKIYFPVDSTGHINVFNDFSDCHFKSEYLLPKNE